MQPSGTSRSRVGGTTLHAWDATIGWSRSYPSSGQTPHRAGAGVLDLELSQNALGLDEAWRVWATDFYSGGGGSPCAWTFPRGGLLR